MAGNRKRKNKHNNQYINKNKVKIIQPNAGLKFKRKRIFLIEVNAKKMLYFYCVHFKNTFLELADLIIS